MNPVLKNILDNKREEIDHQKRIYSEDALVEAAGKIGARRSLAGAVEHGEEKLKVIAEIKRSSPSRMLKPTRFNPKEIAISYEAGGASALSVLTDTRFFCGHGAFIPIVREAVSIPVLRKDFVIDKYQITEAAALGADAILLMALNFENTDALGELYHHALSLGLEVLLEIHSEKEWEKVAALDPKLVGINNRDFLSPELATDIMTTIGLAPRLPADVVIISESGISSPEDIAKLSRAGARGFLIGSAFMIHDDPGAELARLIAQAS
ncbi:Indole-3-glycerol phosphate synthase [hydrothermal vent metagenome]|uniref:indole-3-glycerol-phosphate synthase n=1 Tax=hydrothermal vent metagenome TaxID=652676 RepID=A0A3B1CDT1_9ZZZZ